MGVGVGYIPFSSPARPRPRPHAAEGREDERCRLFVRRETALIPFLTLIPFPVVVLVVDHRQNAKRKTWRTDLSRATPSFVAQLSTRDLQRSTDFLFFFTRHRCKSPE